MLELKRKYLKEHKANFEKEGINVADVDYSALCSRTYSSPVWVHIGAGNLFKGFHSSLAQDLIERGTYDKGIIVFEPFDYEIISKAYAPYDNLNLQVIMRLDGSIKPRVISAVTEAVAGDSKDKTAWERLKEIFSSPSLQMITLSITEKGYGLKTIDGFLRSDVLGEFAVGISEPLHAMTKLAALMHERYKRGRFPIALVSTDNFSHNGDKLKDAMITIAEQWRARGYVEQGFADYLSDSKTVSFPWSMIDKITPYPSEKVKKQLEKIGLVNMEIIKTGKNSVTAPFVNTEEAQYLVIEDNFPNGRPPLEKASVYFCARDIVDKAEKMKVCTCLNPLHTALAVFGCLLGFTSISDEMKDKDLVKIIAKIGCDEGMPVVTDPGIIEPSDFIKEVINTRLPNPNIPDTPQRIATDTSQKLAVRFGETIKLYLERKDLSINSLVFIPLTIAGWCRYLLGFDDNGKSFVLSPDPLLSDLQNFLKGITLGEPDSARGKLKPILSNEKIFGVNLYSAGLGKKIEGYFKEMLAGTGEVRKTLQKYLNKGGK
jgi:fructuronate reductase